MQRPAEPGICGGALSTAGSGPLPQPGSWGAKVMSGVRWGARETRAGPEKEVSRPRAWRRVAVVHRLCGWLGGREPARPRFSALWRDARSMRGDLRVPRAQWPDRALHTQPESPAAPKRFPASSLQSGWPAPGGSFSLG